MRPFRWHEDDTSESIEQAKERNVEYEATCKK